MDYFCYWCKKYSRTPLSTWQKIHGHWHVQVPGCRGDKTDRGQPKRFDKWHKLPVKAHRLFWRFHKNK